MRTDPISMNIKNKQTTQLLEDLREKLFGKPIESSQSKFILNKTDELTTDKKSDGNSVRTYSLLSET